LEVAKIIKNPNDKTHLLIKSVMRFAAMKLSCLGPSNLENPISKIHQAISEMK